MLRLFSGFAVATLLAGVAVAAPPTAYADASAPAAVAPSSLTLTVPSSAPTTTTVTLQAMLTSTPGGGPVASVDDAPVTFEQQQPDGSWAALPGQPATTGTNGVATAAVVTEYGAQTFRAAYDGDEATAAVTSDPGTLTGTKIASVTTLTGPKRIVDETTGTLHVSMLTAGTRKPLAAKATLYSRTRGGRWGVNRAFTLGSDGTAALVVRPRVDTYWKVSAAAGSYWTGSVSPVIFVDNVPPGTPVVYPKGAPRPQALPAQARAVGAGADITATSIPDSVWRSMVGRSWRAGCPVARSGLRLLRINYWGFDGYRHRGSMVVNAHAVSKFVGAFTALYNGHFPIRHMYLPDRFGYSTRSHGANDFAAMRHDDTDAFNCRWVTGRPGVQSPHSYGYAVDINTWENPYRSQVGLLPDRWWMAHSNPRYAWRSRSAPVVRIMLAHGFHWTYGLGDTQHFDA